MKRENTGFFQRDSRGSRESKDSNQAIESIRSILSKTEAARLAPVAEGIPLLAAAAAASRGAYCPYSHYPVGAAVETEDGTIFAGANVENASYGLAICAERVAIASAVAQGHRRLRRLALVAGTARRPARPCGACLQVMAEFAAPDFEILIAPRGRTKQVVRYTLRDLLPSAFTLRHRPHP